MISPFPFAQRPVEFIASARDDLSAMPAEVKEVFGFAIFKAQIGEKHPDAKPLKRFGGAGVLEIVEDFAGDAYRAIYTVKFRGVVYVLDAFQKKSKKGNETPKQDIGRIKSRLKLAEQHYEKHYERDSKIAEA
jgi:phage-related protein